MNAESPGTAYRLLSLLLFPLWLLHGVVHGKNYNLNSYLFQRIWTKRFVSNAPQIWIHAASVGEVNSISPLVKALIDSGELIIFTSFTASGFQTIQKQFGNQVNAAIAPIDFVITSRLFIRRQNIKLCLLMETELWPELLYQTALRGIPIVQVNARLSAKSTNASIFIRYLLRRAISAISLHLTRNQQDKARLIELGANEENIKIIGNLKSQVAVNRVTERLIDRDYLLFASSHEGEEQLFLEKMPDQWQKQLIVIAPRHPRRSESIQKFLNSVDKKFTVRSSSQTINNQTQVYLADTLGELKAFMAHASIVIMGGSFDQKTGGHNLIEPASLGCAIITGPSDSNIKCDIQMLDDGIIQVDNMEDCWQQIESLIAHPEQAKTLGQNALMAIETGSDVLDNYLAEIRPYL